jgi:hypothetical protein
MVHSLVTTSEQYRHHKDQSSHYPLENTCVLEERSDTQHTKWHVSRSGNVVSVTALVGWGNVSRRAIPG